MSVVAIYELNKKWKLSASFVFGTGMPQLCHSVFILLAECLHRSTAALMNTVYQPYHRLDLSAILTPKKNERRKWKSEWVFSVYNAYNRKNPYFIYFDQTGSPFNGTLRYRPNRFLYFLSFLQLPGI